ASTGGFNINYMEISLSGRTGTESIIAEGIHIYPNPVCREMVIKANAFMHHKIEALDITGKIIQSWKTNSEPELRLPVCLPNGVYFVKISDDKHVLQKKIIIDNH
ncbi:MAG: T9SS type A sorting domain-containing protein, partial [Prolixibacteraceae bacterium]|nr:T9SS type A sorting domain-containing protein [Prolixibacteraceae bacterium]